MNWKERTHSEHVAVQTVPDLASEEELKALLLDFQVYLEQFEMRFSNLVSQVACLDATGIDFNLVLRGYQNVMVLVDSSIKLKRFVEKRVGTDHHRPNLISEK